MNQGLLREMFETNVVPNFGFRCSTTRNEKGEYVNSTLEDHWQTFQEAAELVIRECARIDSAENNPDHIDGVTYNHTILQHFGMKE